MTVIERISLQEEMSKAPAATARTTTYTLKAEKWDSNSEESEDEKDLMQ